MRETGKSHQWETRRLLQIKKTIVPPINVQELSPRHREQRLRRLRRLRQSVETNCYEVNSTLLAGKILREALLDAESRKAMR